MKKLLVLSLLLIQSACVGTPEYSPLLRAEPEIGATLSRVPRTLRLYYDALPDVDQSSLKLIGPNGEHQLRGLHTMAADDLMIEIMDSITPGDYLVEWSTVVEGDSALYQGSYRFTVEE